MNRIYNIAGHTFTVSGQQLCTTLNQIEGFKPFELNKESSTTFSFVEETQVPHFKELQYTFEYEDVTGTFGCTPEGYLLRLKPFAEPELDLWCVKGEHRVYLSGNWSVRLVRFALWVGYGLMTLPTDTLAIHSSCIVYRDKAVLFLGESGTGKSTHTRLWREYIPGAKLLNDDSPILRVEDGRIWVYGSAWSGKTPCYKIERYELQGCVRLSQAPENTIQRLSLLQSYGAIHPSCAPEFAYDTYLYDMVSRVIGFIISVVPCYHLACLPDAEAASLSCRTLFG